MTGERQVGEDTAMNVSEITNDKWWWLEDGCYWFGICPSIFIYERVRQY
jgi:hypothetical protein